MSPEPIAAHISEAKLQANQTNAQLSTGPTTTEGKKRSAKNAWRHGLTGQVALMPDEDREEFLRFCSAIVADYHAEGPIETQLAQSIAEDFWRLNRGRAWETNTLALGYFNGAADRVNCDHPQIDDAMTQAIVFEKQAKNFALIALYEQRINRNIAKNEERLRARQAERQAALAQAVEEAKLLEEEAEPQADNWPGLIPTEAESESTALVSLIPTSNEAKTDVLVSRGFVFSKAKIASIIRHERRLEMCPAAPFNRPQSRLNPNPMK